MRRGIAWLIATACLLFLSLKGLKLVNDPTTSLQATNPLQAELFRRYQAASLFQGVLHVDVSSLSALESTELSESLDALGYRLAPPLSPQDPPPAVNLLSAADIRAALAAPALAAQAAALAPQISMVGGLSLLRLDPFALLARLPKMETTKVQILRFMNPPDLDWQRVAALKATLTRWRPRVHALSSELFAYENFAVVSSDLTRSLWLALPCTLALFWYFGRSWQALLFLAAGSVVSYATGLAALRLFSGVEVYSLVLAFSSTFVGFNNEYLVHLSGLDRQRLVRNLPGLSSAIGTTAIGFLVLLGSDAVLVRQMAVVSLGGMLGFIAFMLSFLPSLSALQVRTFTWPAWRLSVRAHVGVGLSLCSLLLILPWPVLSTSVESFQVREPLLQADVVHFEERLAALGAGLVYAVPVQRSAQESLAQREVLRPGTVSKHPLHWLPSASAQLASIRTYQELYPQARATLEASLADLGMAVQLPPTPAPLAVLAEAEFLAWLKTWWPLPVVERVADTDYLFLSLPAKASAAELPPDAILLSPRPHFNAILTALSHNMVRLFGLGLILMTLYLLPILRQPFKVVATLVPLLAAALALLVWLLCTKQALNMIHVMGFALVIALAIDYGAIAVGANFHQEELCKVLWAGLMTIVAFLPLAFAQHPILYDLGMVVSLGASVALLMALALRPQLETKA